MGAYIQWQANWLDGTRLEFYWPIYANQRNVVLVPAVAHVRSINDDFRDPVDVFVVELPAPDVPKA